MLDRARAKARRARVDATFIATAGEALPFPDASFDVVLISLVLHQLPSDALTGRCSRSGGCWPGGRLFVVDLGTPEPGRRTVHSHGTPSSATPFTLAGSSRSSTTWASGSWTAVTSPSGSATSSLADCSRSPAGGAERLAGGEPLLRDRRIARSTAGSRHQLAQRAAGNASSSVGSVATRWPSGRS